jgi:hypothetical protein
MDRFRAPNPQLLMKAAVRAAACFPITKVHKGSEMKETTIARNAFKFGPWLVAAMLCGANLTALHADTMTFSGTINQSIQDGTGPAVNNPALNNIPDGASYTVSLTFNGSIHSPGFYDLLDFDAAFTSGGALENNFNSASVIVTQSGGFDQINALLCLASGSGCNQGNELGLSFMIPVAQLNGDNVSAQQIPGLLPLDLLEDDGVTDIQGSLTNYSYSPPGTVSAVPEPSSILLLVSIVAIAVAQAKRRAGKLPV